MFVPVADRPLSNLDGAELLHAVPAASSHVGVGHVEAFALVAAGTTGQTMRRGRQGGGARGGRLHHGHFHATCLVRILIYKLVILKEREKKNRVKTKLFFFLHIRPKTADLGIVITEII